MVTQLPVFGRHSSTTLSSWRMFFWGYPQIRPTMFLGVPKYAQQLRDDKTLPVAYGRPDFRNLLCDVAPDLLAYYGEKGQPFLL